VTVPTATLYDWRSLSSSVIKFLDYKFSEKEAPLFFFSPFLFPFRVTTAAATDLSTLMLAREEGSSFLCPFSPPFFPSGVATEFAQPPPELPERDWREGLFLSSPPFFPIGRTGNLPFSVLRPKQKKNKKGRDPFSSSFFPPDAASFLASFYHTLLGRSEALRLPSSGVALRCRLPSTERGKKSTRFLFFFPPDAVRTPFTLLVWTARSAKIRRRVGDLPLASPLFSLVVAAKTAAALSVSVPRV